MFQKCFLDNFFPASISSDIVEKEQQHITTKDKHAVNHSNYIDCRVSDE